MRDVKEKVAYLRGLTQGINVNEHSAEGKLLVNIVDVLDTLAEEVHEINVAHLDLETYIETIDEDLASLEEDIYDESGMINSDWVEVECPNCHQEVTFEAEALHEDDVVEITCPSCGNVVYESVIETNSDENSEQLSNKTDNHPGV